MFNLKNTITAVILGFSAASATSFADTFEVSITNVTANQVITPPVVITHTADIALFTPGQTVPEYLVPLAEDGKNSQFAGAQRYDSISAVVTSSQPVPPGQTLTLTIETDRKHPNISIAGMLATSNDAFMAINSETLNFNPDSITTFRAAVYDAGSENNSESCEFIPGPPCGNHEHDNTAPAEGYVFISSGIKGIGDLNAATYDWHDPAAIIKIMKKK